MKKLLSKMGFTLPEAMVVAAMIAVLSAISVPPYMRHLQRSRASEAVGALVMIREGLRDYHVNNNTFFDIGGGKTLNDIPTSVAAGVPTPSTAGVNVDAGVAHYFSNACYSVDATNPASARFTNPGPQDFIVSVNGSSSAACGTSNCATDSTAVVNYRLEMDNTDRVFISYNGGTTWSRY